ncbi:MAG: hypothetical protein VW270_29655, partial [Candidatus Poseidoniales archaeon]
AVIEALLRWEESKSFLIDRRDVLVGDLTSTLDVKKIETRLMIAIKNVREHSKVMPQFCRDVERVLIKVRKDHKLCCLPKSILIHEYLRQEVQAMYGIKDKDNDIIVYFIDDALVFLERCSCVLLFECKGDPWLFLNPEDIMTHLMGNLLAVYNHETHERAFNDL